MAPDLPVLSPWSDDAGTAIGAAIDARLREGPLDVVEWMRQLPYYYEDEHAIYVHAGLARGESGFHWCWRVCTRIHRWPRTSLRAMPFWYRCCWRC